MAHHTTILTALAEYSIRTTAPPASTLDKY
jgi:hypothetical protein